jgi:anti-sigma regulatory factor (Ser/Thr protein kinase)
MRTGAAQGHRGYFHEAAFYGSDEELLDIVVPFLSDGLAAGEPTVVAFDTPNEALVRSAMGDRSGLQYLSAATQYARPASAIKQYSEMLAAQVAAGAGQIRVVGDVPHPGMGVPWDWWARYEAAVNHAYDDFPIWGLCPYDTRITPAETLSDVARTHPRIASADGGRIHHRLNADYEDPAGFLALSEHTAPSAPADVELLDPSPAAARQAVLRAAGQSAVSPDDVADLTVAVSEAVANAFRHGVPPVLMRLWSESGRLVVTVTDRGDGPSDPYAGLIPVRGSSPNGRGLWIAHQICAHVAMGTAEDGFTIQLTAGTPSLG